MLHVVAIFYESKKKNRFFIGNLQNIFFIKKKYKSFYDSLPQNFWNKFLKRLKCCKLLFALEKSC